MGVTGNTALTATKNDLIVELVQRELISKAVLAPTTMDVSRFAKKGAQSIAFPKAGSFTVENRASGAAATTQSLTFAKDKLDLNFRATVSWLIDSMDEMESIVDVESEYAQRAARAHAVYLDQQIIAVLEAAGKATTTAGAISKAIILEMRQILLSQKANPSALTLAVGPDSEALLLNITEFTSYQVYGQVVIPNGALGKIYGIPVIMSTEIGAGHFYMYENEAVALGFQRGPMLDQRAAPEYGAGSTLKVLDQKFGLKALQIAQQGVGASESALIVKGHAT